MQSLLRELPALLKHDLHLSDVALVALLLLIVATIAASYRPAQQAARVHLTEAVQYE